MVTAFGSTPAFTCPHSRLVVVLFHLSVAALSLPHVAGFGSSSSSSHGTTTTSTTSTSTTSHGHGHGADSASSNLIQSMTGICQLEDLALGACSIDDFCDTLRANGKDAQCSGDYFTEWTVTIHDPLSCYPPGLAMSFTAYPFNASTFDDSWALANGHACRTASDIHTFQQDSMVLAARIIDYERPALQAGRLDWSAPVHVCQPREHQHYTEYARTKAFCMSSCLAYAVNHQPCKEECRNCGQGNQPYDCTNVDPSLIPSCYSFHDFRGNFLKYFQKINTENEAIPEIPPEVDEQTTEASEAELSFTRPGVEPCFTPENPPSCHSKNDYRGRNLFGMGSASNADANADAVTACNDIEVLFLSGIQFQHDLHFKAFQGLGTDSGFCSMVQQYYDQCYWCAPEITQQGDDQYCATLETFCEEQPQIANVTVNATETCEQVSYWLDYFNIYPNTVDLCHRAKHSLHSGKCQKVCGREKEALRSPFRPSKRSLPGVEDPFQYDEDYLGADTDAKKKTLVWLTRSSAFLSFLGGSYILYDIFRHKGRCQNNVYYQLLAAMAVFDLCTAAAWSLATHPLPLPQAGYIYGASGNELSCTVQGFFVQLGFTSVFYNVSLSVYYVLVIARGWRDADLKQIQAWLHIVPLLVGIGLAFGGLPVYDWIEYGCMMPIHERWSALVFGVLPLGISISFISASMIWIYFGVRQTARKSGRWALTRSSSIAGTNQSTLETKVFWQAFLYALSFYITWPLLFAVYLWSIDITFDSFALSSIIAFTAPLQGFTDFLVYIRPKVATRITPSMQWLSNRSRDFFFGSSASASSSGAGSGPFASSSKFKAEEETRRKLREEMRDLDPSVMIASNNPMTESAPDATDDGVAVREGNDDDIVNDSSNKDGQQQYQSTDDEAGSFSTVE